VYGELRLGATGPYAQRSKGVHPHLEAGPDAVETRLQAESSWKYRIDTIVGPGENLSIPPIKPIAVKCKHPQVRVVARDEDTEFVECQQCGEVFDAIEYRDMILEEEESKRAADGPA